MPGLDWETVLATLHAGASLSFAQQRVWIQLKLWLRTLTILLKSHCGRWAGMGQELRSGFGWERLVSCVFKLLFLACRTLLLFSEIKKPVVKFSREASSRGKISAARPQKFEHLLYSMRQDRKINVSGECVKQCHFTRVLDFSSDRQAGS